MTLSVDASYVIYFVVACKRIGQKKMWIPSVVRTTAFQNFA